MLFHKATHPKILTVAIHLVLWAGVFLIPLLFIDWEPGRIRYLWFDSFLLIILASFFYFNYFLLIPRFFLKKKMSTYFFFLLGCFVVFSALNYSYGMILDQTIFLDEPARHHAHRARLFFPVLPFLLAFAVSTSIRITNEWLKNEKQRKEMENEKLQSELAFLKSQVNPHFLFNILNNICSLARKKSDDTENAIIKLSQIMRYMMYDSKNEKLPLDRELGYLKSYIELQQMRLPETVKIDFSVEGSPEEILLEPLLLIPFVENAFKHGISYMEDSWITIYLAVSERELNFHVANRVARNEMKDVKPEPGIGLANVRRRLELLYPGKHTILLKEEDSEYNADLVIRFA